MTIDIGRKNREKSPPKRDFRKNITKNVVQSSCRTFQQDVLAQKVIKEKCKKLTDAKKHQFWKALTLGDAYFIFILLSICKFLSNCI